MGLSAGIAGNRLFKTMLQPSAIAESLFRVVVREYAVGWFPVELAEQIPAPKRPEPMGKRARRHFRSAKTLTAALFCTHVSVISRR